MLNASEWNTIIPIIVAIAMPYLAKWGFTDTQVSGWLTAGGELAVASYGLWSTWNMRRVKETAIVSGHAPDEATAKALSAPAK